MEKSRLKNKTNKSKQPIDIASYKKQRNLVVSLNRQSKLDHFNSISSSNDTKPFWKQCKPYFSNKHAVGDSKIMLIENDKMILDNKSVSEKFNNYFSQIVDSLDLYEFPSKPSREYADEIDNIVSKFKTHPSIVKIKKHFKINTSFSFSPTNKDEIVAIIKDLQNNKAAGGEIPLNILKKSNFTFDELTECVNYTLKNGKFPDSLENANITPHHKKDDPTDKVNYRPVSALPLPYKFFERVIYNSNKLLCGFKKPHSTQHALIINSVFIGTILMDLSKAHGCLPHDLIIAKFAICENSLKLLLDYLEERKQRVKIGSSYSFWSDVKRGVTQGSILGPLLFNVFNNYLFMFIENCEICNFADDNTLYSGGMELSSILENLKHDTKILKWFRINSLKANPGEFQFMILGKKQCNKVKLKINSLVINESDTVELLGITIDNVLTFNEHINNLCRIT